MSLAHPIAARSATSAYSIFEGRAGDVANHAKRAPRKASGEERLAIAVLEAAVDDLQSAVRRGLWPTITVRRDLTLPEFGLHMECRHIHEWARGADACITFDVSCAAANLDPQAVREALGLDGKRPKVPVAMRRLGG